MKRSKLPRIFPIVSTLVFLPAVIAMILWSVGLLSLKYLIIINISSFLIEFTLFLFFLKLIMKNADLYQSVTIPKVSMEEQQIPANTEVLKKYISPTNPLKDSIFRVKIELKEIKDSPKFTIIRKCSRDTCEQILNKDIFLDTENLHMFDLRIDRREILNFKFDKDVTIKSFSVEEIYIT